MDLQDAIARRRMVRAFGAERVAPGVVDRLCDQARRAPSAGNTQALAFVVLEQPDDVAAYWDVTLPASKRAGFRWPGLVSAPVLVVVATRPEAYVDRYAEPDKSATGLGADQAAWPVPYWWVDAGAAIEHLLLGAVAEGLGACLFGMFEHEGAVAAHLGVPESWRLVGTVALGHPAPDEPGRSATRPRPELGDVIHRGTW